MKRCMVVLVCVTWVFNSTAPASNSIALSGDWRFALDPEDIGVQRQWYQATLPGNETVRLPGSLQEQGYGNAPSLMTPWIGDIVWQEWDKPKYAPYRSADHFKIPFWLQPDKHYKGVAWYQKTVHIPSSWENKTIRLILERPHWQTRVWIDSNAAGSANYLSVPHIYDVSAPLTPGERLLTIQVDNRMIINVGRNAHSVSDHTQTNWNGIIGDIKLYAVDAAGIEDVQVYPDPAGKAVKVVTTLAAGRAEPGRTGTLVYAVIFDGKEVATQKAVGIELVSDAVHECVIPLTGEIHPWDEFSPNLYTLNTRLETESGTHEQITRFGMRQVGRDGNRIMLNGRRIFLRGTHEGCVFPKTGYPPTDVAAWKRIINICKSHGLNHMRFHSWCPPKAAFMAADELGFYYQVECSAWAAHWSSLDDGRPAGHSLLYSEAYATSSLGDGTPVDPWLYSEADAILKAYGNHPSFLLFAYGNEPTGPEQGAVYLRQWVSHFKAKEPRRLVTGASGWPLLKESDFHVVPAPRIHQWGEQLESRINSKPPETRTDYRDFVNRYPNQPVIAHEAGQWCVYPNFEEMDKYTGVLKPKNFEIFQDFLRQKKMLHQARDFLMASGKLQTLCYKEEIESALRTPDFGGFQLLDLHDFPGQGTALVGVLDAFWDSKPYVSPTEFTRFCGPIVPLARMDKRIFTASEVLTVQVDVSQFGPKDLVDVKLKWSLLDAAGKAVKQGILRQDKLPAGDLYTAGQLKTGLSDLPTPAKYTLEVAIEETEAVNDWDIWVYPDALELKPAGDIMIAEDLDQGMQAHLQGGGKVLLCLNPEQVKTDVALGFSPIFWNTAWTKWMAPHTLGILCDPKHPALAQFPTEYHSNWQWSDLIQHAAAMDLDNLPIKLSPIVQVIPDWFEPKRLGLVFEAKVGKGALVVSSVDLRGDLGRRPAARQLKASLLRYMASDAFAPHVEVDIEAIQSLLGAPSPMENKRPGEHGLPEAG